MSLQTTTRCVALSLAGVLITVASGAAWGDDEPMPAAPPDAVQFTRYDVPTVSATASLGTRTDVTEAVYRRWASRGRADVGFGIGSVTMVERTTGVSAGWLGDSPVRAVGSGGLLMLGLRYRTTAQSSIYADAAHVRGLGLNNDDHVVGKVGVEFKAVQSNWKIAYGGLGFRLAGDARMTLKLRRSGLAIMMRSTF